MNWILIWFVATVDGVSTGSAVYSTEKGCDDASDLIHISMDMMQRRSPALRPDWWTTCTKEAGS